MTPKPSVRPINVPISPQSGSVDSLRWRGFRQSAPFLSLLDSVLADMVQLLSAARTLHPFRYGSTLKYVPQTGTDLSLSADSTQSLSIQIEALRKQMEFKMADPTNG